MEQALRLVVPPKGDVSRSNISCLVGLIPLWKFLFLGEEHVYLPRQKGPNTPIHMGHWHVPAKAPMFRLPEAPAGNQKACNPLPVFI